MSSRWFQKVERHPRHCGPASRDGGPHWISSRAEIAQGSVLLDCSQFAHRWRSLALRSPAWASSNGVVFSSTGHRGPRPCTDRRNWPGVWGQRGTPCHHCRTALGRSASWTAVQSLGVPIAQFLQYRRHDAARIQANNAIMALLAGSHLASHTLQLTDGSAHLLPEIFPRVPHIRRFNLETSQARLLLLDAEVHLAAMAVPYMLAIHEDFANTCLKLLGLRPHSAAGMHAALKAAIPSVCPEFGGVVA